MKELNGQYVLENAEGKVVRTFHWQATQGYLVHRLDTGRIEIVSDIQDLKDQKIPYDLIRKVSASGLQKRKIKLENGASIGFINDAQDTVSLVHIAKDSEEEEKKIYKFTVMTQMGIMLFILFVAFLIEPFLIDKKEEVVVTIPPDLVREMMKTPTVKASKKPVERKKYAAKKVVSPVKKVQRKTLTAKNTAKKRANAPARAKKVQVEKVGALGAFGGMKSGSRNSSGYNLSAKNDSSGSSWTKTGAGGRGGMERAIRGAGLVSGTPGNGGKVSGGGGYGTQSGQGGGRPGYGHVGSGGVAASYFQPLEEEAVIEGGLDQDQIAAVINKHKGEIIYCYEKGLQRSPKLRGRVGVDFTINGSGRVSRAQVESSSLRSSSVESCILGRLKSWGFPKPVGGVNVKVSYPFVLKRVGQG
ncbi:AgmX/PglI C-terminal domain-containing protein [bacterium]|nr:AgmX/PglI C-terminal domain-containing protein [bacterium]